MYPSLCLGAASPIAARWRRRRDARVASRASNESPNDSPRRACGDSQLCPSCWARRASPRSRTATARLCARARVFLSSGVDGAHLGAHLGGVCVGGMASVSLVVSPSLARVSAQIFARWFRRGASDAVRSRGGRDATRPAGLNDANEADPEAVDGGWERGVRLGRGLRRRGIRGGIRGGDRRGIRRGIEGIEGHRGHADGRGREERGNAVSYSGRDASEEVRWAFGRGGDSDVSVPRSEPTRRLSRAFYVPGWSAAKNAYGKYVVYRRAEREVERDERVS